MTDYEINRNYIFRCTYEDLQGELCVYQEQYWIYNNSDFMKIRRRIKESIEYSGCKLLSEITYKPKS